MSIIASTTGWAVVSLAVLAIMAYFRVEAWLLRRDPSIADSGDEENARLGNVVGRARGPLVERHPSA
ncbi:hypothetical protein G4G27_11245 [Sphingomonas sp. So64.6b]|uniref:hypothetical protein n=1 Tax=Sphingomonas sp. So64.6b TaxID=2997354 RepID=UPI00160389CF|nr:hypothetical protein [Sphingomonas sp. So64.6b]QNA84499.1 hypothetical protein G4G27_11245 [Sphingomonas sp. So64.6b]